MMKLLAACLCIAWVGRLILFKECLRYGTQPVCEVILTWKPIFDFIMSRYDMRCRWSAGVFSGGSNYKSWTNILILNAISVCELPIVSLIPCGMIKEIYEFVNRDLQR